MKLTKDYFVSDAKFLELDFKIPYQEMLQEAQRLKEYFVTHRPGSYDHKGWRSLVLHGLSDSKSGHWKDYGYNNIQEVIEQMHWTTFAEKCPVTVDFVKKNFPSNQFGRVRFMLVEAGGHIAEHSDTNTPLLENTNISLSNPDGCEWKWGDGEQFFMPPGKSYIMNIHYPHAVFNNSDVDRYHLIVHRLDSTPQWKTMVETACKQQSVTGKWVNHEVLI